MQIITAIAAVTALCASAASATCYSGGAPWLSTDDANAKLVDACNELVGTYAPNEDRKVCRNSAYDQKYDFEVHNQNNYAASLSLDACVKNTRREIYNCGYGGHEVFGGVYFRYVESGVVLAGWGCRWFKVGRILTRGAVRVLKCTLWSKDVKGVNQVIVGCGDM